MKDSQSKQILSDLMTGVRITALDAVKNYGCLRLAARIRGLKDEGFKVDSEWIVTKSKKRVKSYFMKP